jgi:GNAT superfamily N-acetyltransferase
MNYSYRLATLNDLPTLRMLWRDFIAETQVGYPTNLDKYLDDFTRGVAMAFAQAEPKAFAFLCEAGADPIAFLLYEIQHRTLGEPRTYGYIHAAYVEPGHRREGIIETIGALLGEHMLARGIEYAELSTTPANVWAGFAGFEPYEVRAQVAVAPGLVTLDKRRAMKASERGNGLDHQPLSAESAEKDAP